jgi:hypothetical protein
MKFNRWMALPLAGVVALAIGVVAVNAAPSPSPSATGKNYAQVFVDKLAGILGIKSAQVATDLKSAEVATIDQMVQDGRITKAQGDALKARIQNGQAPGLGFSFGPKFGGPEFGGRGVLNDVRTAELGALATTLKMNSADIMTQLRSGKTLSDLEKQQGVSDSTVQSAVKNAAKGVLDKAVKAGTITQQQEDMLLSRTGSIPFGLGGHRHLEPVPPTGTTTGYNA